MSGYKIEIRRATSTVSKRRMIEVTPFGLYPDDPRSQACMFDSVTCARAHARQLGKEIGFWVHDYTNMGRNPTYY